MIFPLWSFLLHILVIWKCSSAQNTNDGCQGFGCQKVYLDNISGNQRMTRCTATGCLQNSANSDAISLTTSTNEATKQWTMIPHDGKCLLKADNDMYATWCNNCWNSARNNDFGVFLNSNNLNNLASLWEMGKDSGTYTFKQVIHGTNRYLTKCSSCAIGGAPTDMVFANQTFVDFPSKWYIEDIGTNPIACPSVTAPKNGMIPSCANNYGSNCTFSCKYGYLLVGNNTLACICDVTSGTRKWDATPPTCEEIICPTLSAPLNRLPPKCTNENKFGSICTFTCDVGYKLNHTDNLQCVGTGTVIGRWNNTEPVCEVITCPAIPILIYGHFSCTNANLFGSACTFTCDTEEYRLVGSNNLTCTSQQGLWDWDNDFPICQGTSGSVSVSPIVLTVSIIGGINILILVIIFLRKIRKSVIIRRSKAFHENLQRIIASNRLQEEDAHPPAVPMRPVNTTGNRPSDNTSTNDKPDYFVPESAMRPCTSGGEQHVYEKIKNDVTNENQGVPSQYTEMRSIQPSNENPESAYETPFN